MSFQYIILYKKSTEQTECLFCVSHTKISQFVLPVFSPFFGAEQNCCKAHNQNDYGSFLSTVKDEILYYHSQNRNNFSFSHIFQPNPSSPASHFRNRTYLIRNANNPSLHRHRRKDGQRKHMIQNNIFFYFFQ